MDLDLFADQKLPGVDLHGGLQGEGVLKIQGDAVGDVRPGAALPQKQQGGLEERRQADGDDLLAPLVEPVGVPPGDAEHIQAAHRDLNQQDAAPFDVGEENLHHAVGKGGQG